MNTIPRAALVEDGIGLIHEDGGRGVELGQQEQQPNHLLAVTPPLARQARASWCRRSWLGVCNAISW